MRSLLLLLSLNKNIIPYVIVSLILAENSIIRNKFELFNLPLISTYKLMQYFATKISSENNKSKLRPHHTVTVLCTFLSIQSTTFSPSFITT